MKMIPATPMIVLLKLSGRSMSQEDMSDWIEDWHSTLSAVGDDQQSIPLAKAIAAVLTISVKATSESNHTVSETRASRSAMDDIEATSKKRCPAR